MSLPCRSPEPPNAPALAQQSRAGHAGLFCFILSQAGNAGLARGCEKGNQFRLQMSELPRDGHTLTHTLPASAAWPSAWGHLTPAGGPGREHMMCSVGGVCTEPQPPCPGRWLSLAETPTEGPSP